MAVNSQNGRALHPVEYCTYALQAIEVSEERRKRRKRDTGPDVIGMDIKRELLRKAIEDKPDPDQFEAWLMEQVIQSNAGGPIRAMALEVLADYQNACDDASFSQWLADGAPTPRFRGPEDDRRR